MPPSQASRTVDVLWQGERRINKAVGRIVRNGDFLRKALLRRSAAVCAVLWAGGPGQAGSAGQIKPGVNTTLDRFLSAEPGGRDSAKGPPRSWFPDHHQKPGWDWRRKR